MTPESLAAYGSEVDERMRRMARIAPNICPGFKWNPPALAQDGSYAKGTTEPIPS